MEVMGGMERVMALILAMVIQALSRSRFPIVLTTSMVLDIGAEGLITLGDQAIGDGVITTDIGTTVTTGFIPDGTKERNGTFSGMARARPFGWLWYDTPDNAIGYAMHSSPSHDTVIRVYDTAGNLIDDIDGSSTPFNLLELNRTALSDKRSGRREYRTCNSFSKVK